MIKTFSILRRNPTITREEFADQWRDFDQELVSAVSSPPERLVHCHALKLGRSEPRHDGVRIVWHTDDDARKELAAAAAASERSEPWAAITDPAATIELIMDERVVRGDDWLTARWTTRADENVYMLLGFIERKASLTIPEFRDYWWDTHRPLANRLIPVDAQANAYVQNRVFDDSTAPWDGCGELYLDSLDLLSARAAFFGGPESAELEADERRFLEHDTRMLLITDHTVIPVT